MLTLLFPGQFGNRHFISDPQRLNRLKLSTALTGLAALACAMLAARLCLHAGVNAYTLAMHQDSGWLAHVPGPAGLRARYAGVLLAVLLCAAMLGVALSLDWVAQIRARMLLLALMLAGGASIVFNPSANRWMLSVPSAAERTIMWSAPGAAQRMLDQAGLHPAATAYARAQLAMRCGDKAALALHGPALLALVDQWAYRVPRARFAEGDMEVIASFRPEIVYAIDVAVNRQALSHVGMRWEQEHARRAAQDAPPGLAWQVSFGAGTAALAAAVALLWNQMRRRVGVISLQLSRAGRRA